jgi:dTDP-4-dehydrorhamnose reductase
MKVVLLGANGQLGSDIVRTAPEDVKLIPLARKEIDVRNKEMVLKVLKSLSPEVVLNTTAYVKVDLAEEEIEEAFSVNAIGVKNLVDACKETGAILVHISTDYVFDGKKLEKREPYYEDDVPNPINIYGLSKYAGELIIKNYLEKYYIVRSSSLYGVAGASGKGGNFPYTILRKAKAGEKLRVVDDIYMVPTHTLDLAEGIWKLITEEHPYGVYHITHTGYCSWYEFAKKILELAGIEAEVKPVKHTEFPTKARRPLWSVLGTKKGIMLSNWEEGLRRFLGVIIA